MPSTILNTSGNISEKAIVVSPAADEETGADNLSNLPKFIHLVRKNSQDSNFRAYAINCYTILPEADC